MTIYGRYINILDELFDNITDIKTSIIKICELNDLNIDIEIVHEKINDDKGNNALGAFYKDENKIKICKTELISFVVGEICYEYCKLDCRKNDNDIKIFEYYTLYVIAHEMHHAYLYNINNKKYNDIKKEDSDKEYIDKELEKLADENAKKYLSSLDDIAKCTADLAIGLRIKSYNNNKNELETEQESQSKFIQESLKRIQSLKAI